MAAPFSAQRTSLWSVREAPAYHPTMSARIRRKGVAEGTASTLRARLLLRGTLAFVTRRGIAGAANPNPLSQRVRLSKIGSKQGDGRPPLTAASTADDACVCRARSAQAWACAIAAQQGLSAKSTWEQAAPKRCVCVEICVHEVEMPVCLRFRRIARALLCGQFTLHGSS